MQDTAAPLRMGLIRRQPDWTLERFLAYWRDTHGPLAAQVPGLREYWQNAVTGRPAAPGGFTRGPWDFDGFSQLRLDASQTAGAAFRDSEVAARLIADERYFLGTLHIVTALQRTFVPIPEPAERTASCKYVVLLKRHAGLDGDAFQRAWEANGELVSRIPGVTGYRQNQVIARERVKGAPSAYEDMPIDGIAELWFASAAAMNAAVASPQASAAMNRAHDFVAEATAFTVAERRVV